MAAKKRSSRVLIFSGNIYGESALRQAARMFAREADFSISIPDHNASIAVTIRMRKNISLKPHLADEFANQALRLTKKCF